ncbi:hypothetical protein BOW53_10750 [Solemya pervernicosa gill symbiont]|uniref:MSHA biogenesis protein MshI n=1 Tax=Solemya pervernicosa gill symbiont TaxID=642797 RepID=A0A1T2L3D9_9GAMM|nr:hypothetical protein [Solemya pervernicosa gill symbiont]OOZ39615.1 hypothetical protein BOW53_10750 [Solemya pervernicosa gill symbiont]
MGVGLIPFFGKRKRGDQMVGVAFLRAGIAVARVVRSRSQPPRLTLCDFRACEAHEYGAVLEELVKAHRLKGLPCVAVMEQGSYQLLQMEAPDVPDSELRSALRWSIRDLIDFHIDDAVLDVFDLPADAQRGGSNMMNTVVARSSLIKERVEKIESSGLDIHAIDIPELALRNITSMLPEDGAGVALLAMEHDQEQILITRQKLLYLARNLDVPLLVEDLADSGDEFISAEQQQLLDTLILEIQRSQDYYERFYAQPPLQTLMVAANGSSISGMTSYIAQNMGLATSELDLSSQLPGIEQFEAEKRAKSLMAIGAALRIVQEES